MKVRVRQVVVPDALEIPAKGSVEVEVPLEPGEYIAAAVLPDGRMTDRARWIVVKHLEGE